MSQTNTLATTPRGITLDYLVEFFEDELLLLLLLSYRVYTAHFEMLQNSRYTMDSKDWRTLYERDLEYVDFVPWRPPPHKKGVSWFGLV